MSSIDILPRPGELFQSVQVLCLPTALDPTTDEGLRNHVEFCTEEIRMALLNEYALPAGEKHRGVFGYVAFGLGGGQKPDGSTELPRWLPGEFINWGRSLFYPPRNRLMENCRIWLRKGVRAHIYVYSVDPAQTSVIWKAGTP